MGAYIPKETLENLLFLEEGWMGRSGTATMESHRCLWSWGAVGMNGS